MKLTTKKLKKMIAEVLKESTQNTTYKRIMNTLQGDVESIDQVAILTPSNPDAQQIPQEQNDARAEEFEKELAAAGYGFRIVSGMYEGPEDSYMIPHMTLEDAKRFAYKYGQQSFIHSSRDGEGMSHNLEYPDFSDSSIDPSYDESVYGPVFQVPPQVNIKSSVPATNVLGHDQMSQASDYYSHVPDKTWDAKMKGGEERPAGQKAGKRFSIDFDFDQTGMQGYNPEDDLDDPRYVREAKYIFIKSSDVPNTLEARKLVEALQEISKQIVESNRLGSSKYYSRLRLRGIKKQLAKLVAESK